MLNPNSRILYTSALTPPPGMIFDEAVATTFSMDPALLLEVPVYLALMAADGQTDPDPLAVLEAIRRYSKRITVYVQRGRIQVPQIAKPNPLFGYLEDMVVEVTAPGGGVFHPKVWAIRFINPDQNSAMYRLVVLTRNMTTDQSWDLSLQIEGSIAVESPSQTSHWRISSTCYRSLRLDQWKQSESSKRTDSQKQCTEFNGNSPTALMDWPSIFPEHRGLIGSLPWRIGWRSFRHFVQTRFYEH